MIAVGGSASPSKCARGGFARREAEIAFRKQAGVPRPAAFIAARQPSTRHWLSEYSSEPLMNPMRRWPSSTRCSVASRAACSSSMVIRIPGPGPIEPILANGIR